MMCDVMPTISEDGTTDRDSSYSGDDANFEQLMVNMLDERDKLMDTLRETQENLALAQVKLNEVERERDSLNKQVNATQPQVSFWAFLFTVFMGFKLIHITLVRGHLPARAPVLFDNYMVQ